ncbi:MAG: DUF4175 family protein [Nitrospirae bacterium]|nr:DUF4175 family protein [Nitrospirota bacterium]
MRRATAEWAKAWSRLALACTPLGLVAGFYAVALAEETFPEHLPSPPYPGVAVAGALALLWCVVVAWPMAAKLGTSNRLRWIESASGLAYQPLRTLREAGNFDPAFSAAVMAFGERETGRLDYARLVQVPSRRSRQALQAGGVALLALALGFTIFPRAHLRWLRLQLPAAAAAWLPSSVTGRLALREISLLVHPPAHAHRPPHELRPTADPIQVLKGSRVEMRVSTEEPLRSASVLFEDGASLPAQVAGGRIEATFDVLAPTRVRVAGLNRRSEPVESTDAVAFSIEEDQPPRVSLLQPSEDLTLEETQRVPLQYSAEDDFGLQRLELVILRGKDETTVPLERLEGEPKATTGEYLWDLIQLSPSPGEVIAFHIRARDNDTVSGPKSAVSETRLIEILSADHRLRAEIEKLRAVWEGLIQTLAVELPTAEPGMSATDRRTSHSTIDTRVRELLGYLDDILAQIGEDQRVSAEWLVALRALRQDLHDANAAKSRFMAEAAPSLDAAAPALPALYRSLVGEEIEQIERGVLGLDRFFDAQALAEAQQGFQQALQSQQDLADILSHLDLKDPKAASELRRRLDELQRSLAGLYEDLMKTARQIPDEILNSDAAEPLGGERLGDLMNEIRAALDAGDLDKARELLARLRESMEKLMSSLDAARRGAQGIDEEDYNEAMELYREVERIERDQVALRGETFEASKTGRNEAQALRDWLHARLGEIRGRVASSAEGLTRLEAESRAGAWTPPVRMSADASAAALNQVENHLERSGLDDLLPQAQGLEAALRAGVQSSRTAPPPDGTPEAPKIREDIEKAHATAREIVRTLQNPPPPQAGAPSAGGSPDSSQALAGRQDKLAEETRGLSDRISGLAERIPMMGRGPGRKIGEAAQDMDAAGSQARQGSLGRALGHQDQAIQNLREATGRMQQAMNGMSQGLGGLAMPFPALWPTARQEGRGGSPVQKVQIPTPDQHRVPKEFREDILEAMKEKYPERFEQPIKRYYEELLR